MTIDANDQNLNFRLKCGDIFAGILMFYIGRLLYGIIIFKNTNNIDSVGMVLWN